MKRKRLNKRVIFEFVSITFAVFLGLMLNTWKESNRNSKLAEQTIENIKTEVVANKKNVSKMLADHEERLATVDSLLLELEDSIKVKNREVNIVFHFVNSTSWETAKLTQAVAYMDLNFVTEVSGIYSAQDYYQSLVRIYAQQRMTTLSDDDEKKALEKMQVFLYSIVWIERNLIESYDDFLKLPNVIG